MYRYISKCIQNLRTNSSLPVNFIREFSKTRDNLFCTGFVIKYCFIKKSIRFLQNILPINTVILIINNNV